MRLLYPSIIFVLCGIKKLAILSTCAPAGFEMKIVAKQFVCLLYNRGGCIIVKKVLRRHGMLALRRAMMR